MTREEIVRNLKYIMKKHKDDRVNTFDTNIYLMCKDILEYLEQEPNKEAYNQGYEDGYLAGQKNIAERFEGLIKSGISTDTPDDIKYVIGLLNELSSVNPQPCEDAIRRQAVLETLDDMDNALDEDRTVENYKELLKECYEVLPPVNPQDPETEIEELDFVQEHKKIPVTLQVQKYCDRNICVSNEYNGIGCDECEVMAESEGDE